jgi:hypothetical protein
MLVAAAVALCRCFGLSAHLVIVATAAERFVAEALDERRLAERVALVRPIRP